MLARTTLTLALVALTGGMLAGPAPAQEVERRLRLYDISMLVQEVKDNPGPTLEADRGPGMAGGAGLTFGEAEAAPERLDPDQLVELITGTIDPDSWGHEATRCDVIDSTLYVTQTAVVHAKIAAMLSAMRTQLGRQTAVAVRVYKATAAQARALTKASRGQTGVFAPGAAAAACQAAGLAAPLQSTTVTLRDRQRGHSAVLRRRTFVADYEVEVAQKAAIPDPIVESQQFGLVGDCTSMPSQDGTHVMLEVRLGWAALLDGSKQVVTEHGPIELPERVVSNVRGTLRLAYGETWCAAAAGPAGAGYVFLVTPTRRNVNGSGGGVPVAQPTTHRFTRAYNLGELIYTPRDFPGPSVRSQLTDSGAAGGIPGLGAADEAGVEPITADNIADLIRQNLDPDSWEHRRVRLDVGGSTLVVTHTGEMHKKLAAYLRDVAAKRPPGLQLETALVAADDALLQAMAARKGAAVESAAADRWLQNAGDKLLAYGTVAARNRQRVYSAVIQTVRMVADYDVEVAQEAKITDPIVRVVREGYVGDLRPVLAGDLKTVSLELRPGWARIARPVRTLKTPAGEISLVDVADGGVEANVVLPTGQWGAVRAGSDAHGRPLVLLVAARIVR